MGAGRSGCGSGPQPQAAAQPQPGLVRVSEVLTRPWLGDWIRLTMADRDNTPALSPCRMSSPHCDSQSTAPKNHVDSRRSGPLTPRYGRQPGHLTPTGPIPRPISSCESLLARRATPHSRAVELPPLPNPLLRRLHHRIRHDNEQSVRTPAHKHVESPEILRHQLGPEQTSTGHEIGARRAPSEENMMRSARSGVVAVRLSLRNIHAHKNPGAWHSAPCTFHVSQWRQSGRVVEPPLPQQHQPVLRDQIHSRKGT